MTEKSVGALFSALVERRCRLGSQIPVLAIQECNLESESHAMYLGNVAQELVWDGHIGPVIDVSSLDSSASTDSD